MELSTPFERCKLDPLGPRRPTPWPPLPTSSRDSRTYLVQFGLFLLTVYKLWGENKTWDEVITGDEEAAVHTIHIYWWHGDDRWWRWLKDWWWQQCMVIQVMMMMLVNLREPQGRQRGLFQRQGRCSAAGKECQYTENLTLLHTRATTTTIV